MALKTQTLSEKIQRARADIESRIPGAFAQNENTVVSAIAYSNAGLAYGLEQKVYWTSKQIVPHLADDDIFLMHCEFWGVWRKQPAAASGTVIITAITDATIDAGTQMQRPDGQLFEVAESAILPAGQTFIKVIAVEDGKTGNTAPGVKMQLVSPVLGVNNELIVSEAAISGGADIESIDSLRARLLFRVQYPPSGGNQYDYIRWALECSGVTRAWCFPKYMGLGSVAVMFVLDDNADIFPTQNDLNRVYDYIQGHINPLTNQYEGKPPGAELIVLGPKPKPLNPSIRLTPDSPEIRQAVIKNLNELLTDFAPGQTAFLSAIRAAISNAPGEIDHAINLTGDMYAAKDELIILGAVTWL